ncbi:hypothetical protein [Acinetobacter pseudolwoffii]|uniref:hypothetical protein n=1 Tax=Acinetobacter pseudolwoffii TaxID=2053287 RepID=UPI003FD84D96
MRYSFSIKPTKPSSSRLIVIAGKVLQLGLPVSRKIRVYCRNTGILIKSGESDASGKYKFYLPDIGPFTLVSIDKHRLFNAVIQDNVVPK